VVQCVCVVATFSCVMRITMCCSVLQCALQSVAVCCSVCYSELQCVAVCCSVLQCVAVCVIVAFSWQGLSEKTIPAKNMLSSEI